MRERCRIETRLDALGFRFARYADDFVILCRSRSQAEEALTQASVVLDRLGLSLSPEKTKITSSGKGYSFLGFVIPVTTIPRSKRRTTYSSVDHGLELLPHLGRPRYGVQQDRASYACQSELEVDPV